MAQTFITLVTRVNPRSQTLVTLVPHYLILVKYFIPSTRIGVNFMCIFADNQTFIAVLPGGLTVVE